MVTQTLSSHLGPAFTENARRGVAVDADNIRVQVKQIFADSGQELPQTPRRPDVRLIIDNISGQDFQFQNPGNHSVGAPEKIPASGDKKAVMVMIKGATLAEQEKNARELFGRYNLGKKGLSNEFVRDLKAGKLADLVVEAYGPAPFQGQADKLKDVNWTAEDGTQSQISPQRGSHAAFGARPPTTEIVFQAKYSLFLPEYSRLRMQGTGTTTEAGEMGLIDFGISSDGTRETTRPIAPSVAEGYYGSGVKKIPEVVITADGRVKQINLGNGTKLVSKNPGRGPVKPRDPVMN